MTAEEADQRIIKSRQTLALYRRGGVASAENLELFTDEIARLEAIALAHPSKATKLARLCNDWRDYAGLVRGTLH